MRQNSLKRKENYGFDFLLNKVPLSYFPPQNPAGMRYTSRYCYADMVLKGIQPRF